MLLFLVLLTLGSYVVILMWFKLSRTGQLLSLFRRVVNDYEIDDLSLRIGGDTSSYIFTDCRYFSKLPDMRQRYGYIEIPKQLSDLAKRVSYKVYGRDKKPYIMAMLHELGHVMDMKRRGYDNVYRDFIQGRKYIRIIRQRESLDKYHLNILRHETKVEKRADEIALELYEKYCG